MCPATKISCSFQALNKLSRRQSIHQNLDGSFSYFRNLAFCQKKLLPWVKAQRIFWPKNYTPFDKACSFVAEFNGRPFLLLLLHIVKFRCLIFASSLGQRDWTRMKLTTLLELILKRNQIFFMREEQQCTLLLLNRPHRPLQRHSIISCTLNTNSTFSFLSWKCNKMKTLNYANSSIQFVFLILRCSRIKILSPNEAAAPRAPWPIRGSIVIDAELSKRDINGGPAQIRKQVMHHSNV